MSNLYMNIPFYMNIPQAEGLTLACKLGIRRIPGQKKPKSYAHLQPQLKKKLFPSQWKKKYLQIHGMVMDTAMAVDFANSFLYAKKITDYLEAKYKRFCEAFEEKEH